MKNLLFIFVIVAGSLMCKTTTAQISIRANIGFQPSYQSSQGYDQDDYFYLPDIEAYYNLGSQMYYYQNYGRWVCTSYLPSRYGNYNYSNLRRYSIRSSRPYMRNNEYRNMYYRQARNYNQQAARDNNYGRYSQNNDYSPYSQGRYYRGYQNQNRYVGQYNGGDHSRNYEQGKRGNRGENEGQNRGSQGRQNGENHGKNERDER
jgi:hypothetical protein